MKDPIKLRIEIKSRVHMTPQIFFRYMPYMFENFNMVDAPKDPDYVIFAGRFPKGNYKRIWYTHENHRPRLHDCDWATSFDHDEELKNPKHMRMSNYIRLGAGVNLLNAHKNVDKIMQSKTKFCTYVYSHGVPIRQKFFKMLSKYKKVHAPGRCCHNMKPIGGHRSAMASKNNPKFNHEKVEFYKPYKFVITFEHSSYPGYCTEKIYHALLAGCIPIYWGSPMVHRDFNQKRFINAHAMGGHALKKMVDRVAAIDQNEKLYRAMLSQPCYPGNKLTPYVDPKRIVSFFRKVFSS